MSGMHRGRSHFGHPGLRSPKKVCLVKVNRYDIWSIPYIKLWPQGLTPISGKIIRGNLKWGVGIRGRTAKNVWNAEISVVVDMRWYYKPSSRLICRRKTPKSSHNWCFLSHMCQSIWGPNILPNAISHNLPDHFPFAPSSKLLIWTADTSFDMTVRFGNHRLAFYSKPSAYSPLAIRFNLNIYVVGVFVLSGTVYNAKISGFLKPTLVCQGLFLA